MSRDARLSEKFLQFLLRESKLAKGKVSDGNAFKFLLYAEMNESSFGCDTVGSNFQQKNLTFYFSNDF